MRIRTMVTFAAGAATGAGWMYLADPAHGPSRRKEFRRNALRQGQHAVLALGLAAKRRAEELVFSAVAGFEQGRVESRPGVDAERAPLRAVGRNAS